MPILHPTQRKRFTISREDAMYLAARLANGESLIFQSSANRNWVAKLARTRYGADVKVSVLRDQLVNPRNTVEGRNEYFADSHWMPVYKAVKLYDAPRFVAPAPTYSRHRDYEGNIW